MVETPQDAGDINKNPEEQQTPEEPVNKELDETPTVEQLSQKVKELEESLTKEKADKVGIVEQLKEVRRAKHEAEAKSLGKTEPESKPIEDATELKVKEILRRERETLTSENKVVALHKFWEKHSEFNPENDISGIKMDAVHRSLKRLNTSAHSVEDILGDYEDALKLMGKSISQSTNSNFNQFASSSQTPTNPLEDDRSPLTPAQEKLRKEKGWTVKKYLDMKTKHPNIIL